MAYAANPRPAPLPALALLRLLALLAGGRCRRPRRMRGGAHGGRVCGAAEGPLPVRGLGLGN
eukprot:4853413-Lingulodinium_polyedra.AAC.1